MAVPGIDWGNVLSGIGSLINAGASIGNAIVTADNNNKALDLQRQQLETTQKNLADAKARQDSADKSAINTSSDFANQEKTQGNASSGTSLSGGLSGGLSTSTLPMESY